MKKQYYSISGTEENSSKVHTLIKNYINSKFQTGELERKDIQPVVYEKFNLLYADYITQQEEKYGLKIYANPKTQTIGFKSIN